MTHNVQINVDGISASLLEVIYSKEGVVVDVSDTVRLTRIPTGRLHM